MIGGSYPAYEEHRTLAHHVIARYFPGLNGADYDDARQVAIIAAWRAGDREADNRRGYLYRTMRNAILEWKRAQVGRDGQRLPLINAAPLDETHDAPNPTDAYQAIDDAAEIAWLFRRAKLTHTQRLVLGAIAADIAQQKLADYLGIPAYDLWNARSSAMRKLRAAA